MFCKSCGKIVDNDSKYCVYCGTKLFSENGTILEQSEKEHSISVTQKINPDNNLNIKSINSIYDTTYQKETDATLFGIFLLLPGIIIAFTGFPKFESQDGYNQFRLGVSIASLIFRIIATIWVVNIAKRQNRDTTIWGLFAFFIPSFALIIIGQLKKIFAEIITNNNLSREENSQLLYNQAYAFFNDNKFSESKRFLEAAIQLNPENSDAEELLQKVNRLFSSGFDQKGSEQIAWITTENKTIYFLLNNDGILGAKINILGEIETDGAFYFKNNIKIIVKKGIVESVFYLKNYKNLIVEQVKGNVASIGDKVFIDNNFAPDGKYSTGFMAGKICVENGSISKFE